VALRSLYWPKAEVIHILSVLRAKAARTKFRIKARNDSAAPLRTIKPPVISPINKNYWFMRWFFATTMVVLFPEIKF
jgi:hypothetical protein